MPEANEQAVVEVSGLTRKYRRKLALDNVTLRVPPGCVYGLVGENGAGKTTLLKHLLGSLRAQQGTVRVFGHDPAEQAVEVLAKIGYLSEDRDIPGWMRVRELIAYTSAFYPGWDEAYAESLRERFNLQPDARIRQLSRGERAKMGLLCALAYRPPLLLLDEPSSGLDPSARRDILGAIVRTVADEGRTVIFSSHLLEEVERVADIVAMIHGGQCVFEGALDDIKAKHQRFTLQQTNGEVRLREMPGVLRAEPAGPAEWTVIHAGDAGRFREAASERALNILEETAPTLEEIFLARVSPGEDA